MIDHGGQLMDVWKWAEAAIAAAEAAGKALGRPVMVRAIEQDGLGFTILLKVTEAKEAENAV